MMESKKEVMHTPEPWFSDEKGNIWRRHPRELYQNGGGVAGDMPIALCNRGWYGDSEGYPEAVNARRIVACVNACKGIGTETLERYHEDHKPDNGFGLHREAGLISQRDELLAALNNLVDIIDKAGLGNLSKGVQLGAMSWYVKASDAVEWAREAIAKCEVKS